MGTRDFCTTTKWNAAGRNALGTPIKAYGESVQRDLPPANAKHNAARLPPHLLQQHGKAGMNPKTLQYLMGHSEIGVTMNTYTHLGLEDAQDELRRMEELEQARKEVAGKGSETA